MPDAEMLDAIEQLAVQVGTYQLSRFRAFPSDYGNEKMARELVSEVDLNAEEQLIEGLRRLLPEAGIYAEERGSSGNQELRWVIDPLDGTTNFLSGLDQFSISIALEQGGQPLLGLVHRPASRETFRARRGSGLFHNSRRCNPASAVSLTKALVGTGFPYRSPDLADFFFPSSRDILYRCRGIRRFGSAALDLSYVAAGFLQGFWESDLQPYDVAAALLFLDESGCPVTNQRGEPYTPGRDRILVCAPPAIHPELLQLVAKHYPAYI